VSQNSDVVLIIVGDDHDLEKAFFGPRGLSAGLTKEKILVILSTVSSRICHKIARFAKPHGVDILDAPMTRGVPAAEEGTLLLFVGGDSIVLDRCQPILSKFSTDTFFVGPIGSGQIAKAINNAILWTEMVVVSEGFSLADKAGLDLKLLRQGLLRSSARNWPLEVWDKMRPVWANKDMSVALMIAKEYGVSVDFYKAVKQKLNKVRFLGTERKQWLQERSAINNSLGKHVRE
jgi:3-hydroxyisobutyrate dehydrogenase-like beta-hydroxyacid dehydrogenase